MLVVPSLMARPSPLSRPVLAEALSLRSSTLKPTPVSAITSNAYQGKILTCERRRHDHCYDHRHWRSWRRWWRRRRRRSNNRFHPSQYALSLNPIHTSSVERDRTKSPGYNVQLKLGASIVADGYCSEHGDTSTSDNDSYSRFLPDWTPCVSAFLLIFLADGSVVTTVVSGSAVQSAASSAASAAASSASKAVGGGFVTVVTTNSGMIRFITVTVFPSTSTQTVTRTTTPATSAITSQVISTTTVYQAPASGSMRTVTSTVQASAPQVVTVYVSQIVPPSTTTVLKTASVSTSSRVSTVPPSVTTVSRTSSVLTVPLSVTTVTTTASVSIAQPSVITVSTTMTMLPTTSSVSTQTVTAVVKLCTYTPGGLLLDLGFPLYLTLADSFR